MSAVVINLRVGGVADVREALQSVEQAVVRAQKNTTRATAAGSKERSGLAGSEAKAQAKEWAKTAKEAETFEKHRTKLRETSVAYASKLAKQEADAEIKEAGRAERERTRETERESRRRMDIQTRSALMAGRIVAQQVKDEERVRRQFSKSVYGNIGGTANHVGNVVKGGAAAVTFGAAVAAGDAIRGRIAEERAYTAVSNAAYVPEVKDANGKIVQKTIERPGSADVAAAVAPVAAATNIGREDLANALGTYSELSSDYAGGKRNLMRLSKLAKGSNADLGDVMGAAGITKAQNKDISDDDLYKTMLTIVGQGKLGNIGLRDLASNAGKITASRGMYAGDQTDNQRKLLGLAQLAAPAAGSTEEAATTVTRFGSDALAHRGEIGSLLGHSITDKAGMLTDPGKIAAEVLAKTGGNLGKVHDLGFGERSAKLFEELAPIYQAAEKNKKGSGKQAVLDTTAKFEGATYSVDDAEKDFAAVMKDSGEKLDGAVTAIKNALADGLEPHLDKLLAELPQLVPKVLALVEGFASLADSLANSPIRSVFGLITASILKDIAAAKLSQLIENAITGKLSGSTIGAVSIAAGAVAITVAGMEAIDKGVESQNKREGDIIAGNVGASGIISHLRKGDPGAVADAQAEISRLTDSVKDQKDHPNGGWVDQAFSGPAMLLPSGKEAFRTKEANRAKELSETETSLKNLKAALDAVTAAAGGTKGAVSPNAPNRNGPMSSGPRGGAT